MPRTRPLRALLPTLLAFLPLALATASGHVRDSLLRSKHWLVDGPALRTAYVAAAWAAAPRPERSFSVALRPPVASAERAVSVPSVGVLTSDWVTLDPFHLDLRLSQHDQRSVVERQPGGQILRRGRDTPEGNLRIRLYDGRAR
jgi:hypothetical protein